MSNFKHHRPIRMRNVRCERVDRVAFNHDPLALRSQEEVGEMLGMSRQRVSQIEREALRKLELRLRPVKGLAVAIALGEVEP